jgi:hypothetical protein
MKTNCRKNTLTFGGFIRVAHDAWNDSLAERYVEPETPLVSARNAVQVAGPKAGFPNRITAKLRAAIDSHVPVGYEDETGFHYGTNAGDGAS